MPSWLASLIAALLPAPERQAFQRRFGGDPARASMLIGAIEFLAGVHFVYESAMGYFRPLADGMATELWHQANRRSIAPEEMLGLTWGGAVVWLFWLLQPTTWLLLSVPATGLMRAASYLTIREAVGEPVIWLILRLLRFGRQLVGGASERAEFGDATAQDEVVTEGDSTLLIHTARLRPAWNELVTIEVGERFFRVAEQDQIVRHGRRRYRYRLVEAPEHEVIRSLLRYELPQRSDAGERPSARRQERLDGG